MEGELPSGGGMLGFGGNSNDNGTTPLDDSISSMAMMMMMSNSSAGGSTDHHGHRVSTEMKHNKGFNPSGGSMLGFGGNSDDNGTTPLDDSILSMAMMMMMSNSSAGGSTDHHGHRVSTEMMHTKGFNPSVGGMLGFEGNNNGSCSTTPLDDSISSMAMMMMLSNSSAGGSTDHHGHRVSTGMMHNKGFNMGQNNNTTTDHDHDHHSSMIKAKIMAHPYFFHLLSAYANCQKVGAPAEVVARLEETCAAAGSAIVDNSRSGAGDCVIGEDPALDKFMEAYCEMLIKYEQELTKPTKEALLFLSNMDSHLKALIMPNFSGINIGPSTKEEEVDEANGNHIDPHKELKNQLLRRYNGYLGDLKQEFLRKKKKGKLPIEAREQLLDWWSRHYKWPYPSETQKIALAESTGLDQKQIKNWFVNQRKRHWKPTEDQMQYFEMDASYPDYYLGNAFGSPIPMDFPPSNH